jgi:hypothetical protein
MGLLQHRRFFLSADETEQKGLSCSFDLGLPEPDQKRIVLATGIGVYAQKALDRALLLSQLSRGYNIHVIHDVTQGWIPDLAKAGLSLLGIVSDRPVAEICRIWRSFFCSIPERDARLLQFCHSKGTIFVRRALEGLTYEERRRIQVVSIAGATYIPPELCWRIDHYVSARDIVPRLDPKERRRCIATTTTLAPHLEAPYFDHTFFSPTYREVIQRHVDEYLH